MQVEMLKDAVDLEHLLNLLGFTIRLRNSKEMRGPCQIHGGDNKTAFRVRRDTKRWVCYSHHCEEKVEGAKQDDVIGLVMAVKKIPFYDAIKFLSDMTGIPVNGEVDKEAYANYREQKDKNDFINVSEKLQDVKLPILFSEEFVERANKKRTGYFLKRGFTKDVLDYFKVGGMFRDDFGVSREFIPVWDDNERLVGMQGRRIDGGGDPTYITKGDFQKSKVLYNLGKAKHHLGELNPTIIVVEGVTDVWSLFMRDYLNCVSTFGTGVSEDQFNLLTKYALNVILLFDGDNPGRGAAKKSKEVIEKGANAYIVNLPEGADPSSVNGLLLDREITRAYKELGVI
jgi:DNA primase